MAKNFKAANSVQGEVDGTGVRATGDRTLSGAFGQG